MDVPPLNNDISSPLIAVSSQIAFESFHVLPASHVLTPAGATQGHGTSAIPRSTPKASTSTFPPLASISPQDGAISPYDAVLCIPSSDVSDMSSPPSPIPALDNVLHTVSQLSSDPPATRPDYAPRPEAPHSSIRAITPPAPSRPLSTSAPDPGVNDDGVGSTKAALRNYEVLFEPPSVNPTNAVAAAGHKLPSPTLPAVTGVVTRAPSRLSLDSGHTGDRPLSHRYNIV
ncbi:hypothetical protein EDB92DRAFT_1866863 [Lactarius akahatsu]|uniref:Uncharacterized protein n=1 Tax=Lactarius akahatsu TaxID=416441 RepID=A0AAD4L7D2_9AGAM|nr:hypothetical protein EDB92DRAFT_1897951 [Lactarius akahatsu]KAH8989820.1 hypothetical protein EDB92DRAFT_1866863 [Lactarius akahatsu]